jgi:homoserine kinase
MSSRRVVVRAPASSANLGPGFDCVGLALDLWGQLTFTVSSEAASTEGPLCRMAAEALRHLFRHLGCQPPAGLRIEYDSAIPVARGLGASAVARAAALLAGNALLSGPLGREHLLTLGADLEGHADNMAPALFGGLQVVARDDGIVHQLAVPLPTGLKAVLFVPEFAMPTQRSRQVLPRSLSRGDAVHNIGRATLLVAALAAGRLELLDAATQDRLHQPARARLFPAMFDLFEAAKGAGAHCAYLSGGGSAVCALATEHPEVIAEAMARAAQDRGVEGETIVTAPTGRGAEVLEEG